MQLDDNEEKLLRSVALQNARAILLARERAERALLEAKEALERKIEELAQQRESFRVTLSSIGDGVITTDTEARITFLNPVAETMTGWEFREAIGQPLEKVFRIINEQTRQPAPNPVTKVLAEGVVVGLANHTALISRDGRETAIDDSAAPIRDARGNISGVVMVFHDVTERRRTEIALQASNDALLQSETRSKMAMEAGQMGAWEWNISSRKIIWSPTLEAIHGLAPGTFDGTFEGFQRDMHPEDRERILAAIQRSLEEQTEYRIEYRIIKPDGQISWIEARGKLFFDAQGQPERMAGICMDATARKSAEEALRRSEEELRALANSIPQLAWMANPDGHIFWYNRRWYDYTGTIFEQMEGWGWQTLHDPKMLPLVIERWKESIRTGEPFDMEFPLRGADGVFRWFLTRVNPVRDSEGRVVRWFGTNTNVDEVRRTREALREAQEKLSRHAEDLEIQVAERTASLRETIGELEAFSYSISHDLRAPLRAMQSFAQILGEEYAPQVGAEGKEYIRRITTASERMDRLIQDVLNYSRVARTELPLEPVHTETFLRDILQTYPMFQPPAADIQLEGSLPVVLGNQAVLTQCISNLLGNAVKFVPPGVTPRIRVRAEEIDDPQMVRLCFKDNGVGIDHEQHEKIFGIFQRASKSYEGTGIGLAIVRKGVERMGGKVGLESQPGKGSTFWLELKRAET